jgi:hypothetical protein
MAKRSNRTASIAALSVAAIALVLVSLAPAHASSRLCRDLESRLAGISVARAASPQARRYEQAITNQRAQMDKAESQRRRAGCTGFPTGRGAGDVCQSLTHTLQRMQSNLASLEAQHRRLSRGTQSGDPRRERQRILAALDQNGCRDAARVARQPALFDQLFGNRVDQGNERRRPQMEVEPRERSSNNRSGIIHIRPNWSGSYRTLCVRTCDGYFFPISYNASGPDIDRDAAACTARCPGTEVELFMHRTPTEEAEQMISRAGVRYTDLPTAFRYRQAGFVRPEGCECNPVRNFSIIAGGAPRSEPEEIPPPAEPIIPVPNARPDPAADPETLANRDGGLDLAAVKRLFATRRIAPMADPDDEDGERRIRVVGPTFLPDPEGAIDLTAPAQNPIQ